MLGIISEVTKNLLPEASNKTNVVLIKNNFAVAVAVFQESENIPGITFSYSNNDIAIQRSLSSNALKQDSISLPKSAVTGEKQSSKPSSSPRIGCVGYKDGKFFKTDGLSSQILSAEVMGKSIKNLQEPIVITLDISKADPAGGPLCSFWDFSKSGMTFEWYFSLGQCT